MGTITITKDKDEVTDFLTGKLGELSTMVSTLIENILSDLEPIAEETAPYMTGELSRSHVFELESLFSGVLYATVPQFVWVIEGTPPHWIGSPVLIPFVGWRYIGEHPGTQPNDYMLEVISLGEGPVETRCDEFAEQLIS